MPSSLRLRLSATARFLPGKSTSRAAPSPATPPSRPPRRPPTRKGRRRSRPLPARLPQHLLLPLHSQGSPPISTHGRAWCRRGPFHRRPVPAPASSAHVLHQVHRKLTSPAVLWPMDSRRCSSIHHCLLP
jgi:hypothetical protein